MSDIVACEAVMQRQRERAVHDTITVGETSGRLRPLARWVTTHPRTAFGRTDLMTANTLLIDYLPIAVFLGVSLVIGLALMAAPFLLAVRNPDPEKVSAYECGFNAFDDARMKFDIRFYLVSILFIISLATLSEV